MLLNPSNVCTDEETLKLQGRVESAEVRDRSRSTGDTCCDAPELASPDARDSNSLLSRLRIRKRQLELKLGRFAGPAMFLGVGATGMVVDLTSFTLLMAMLPIGPARAVAIGIAMTWNFWLNRRITFSASRASAILPQYVKFCVSCTAGATINWGVSMLLGIWQPELSAQVSAFCGIVAGTGFNYVLSKNVVFRVTARPNIEV